MSTRALVVHASNLLARGFIAIPGDRVSPSGEPTNALYAVARSITRAIAFKKPKFAVAVIDAVDLDHSHPAPLRQQNERLADLLEDLGLSLILAAEPASYVASYAQSALDAGCDVVIVGSDKRFAQLVSDDLWWYDPYKDVRYTPELVRKRFEVGPENVADWLALVGDDDTLGGVKGVGKKGATSIITSHGSLTAAIANAEAVEGRAGKALRADLAAVEKERGLAHLDRSRALPLPIEDLKYRGRGAATLRKLYGELGFVELLTADAKDALAIEVCATQASLVKALAAFRDGAVSAVPLIEDPSAALGQIAGLALAQAGRVIYVPLEGEVPPPLASFLEHPDQALIGHDTKDLATAFARLGVTVRGIEGDSACASHLTEPSNWAPHDLPLVARFVLHRALPSEDSVRGVGKRRKRWAQVVVASAASYAGGLADAAEKVWLELAPRIDSDLLAEYLALSETLTRMERVGIACDQADLAAAGVDFERIASELESEIHEIAGKAFNLGSTKQLGAVLFEDLGLPIVKRTKTGWSTANEALERIENAHPIVPLVIRWRRLRRLMDSWVTSLIAAIGDDGRVHSTFNPSRSFSGRLVNSNPDLGRVPGRTPEMARIRHAFAAPDGATLLSVDYRQLGLYVLAHLGGDPALAEPLLAGDDMHRLTAAAVLEKPADAISVEERQLGKIINFATFAGQGASSLALQLGVSAAEAKAFIARFDNRYSRVRAFQDEQLRLAKERGYIVTIAGRRWPIGGLESTDPMLKSYAERLARRATHEGSVADVSRRGLLAADRALRAAGLRGVPLLQVHDEVLFEIPIEELADSARVTADAMRGAFELAVPLRVGCKAGPNWAELEPVDGLGDSDR